MGNCGAGYDHIIDNITCQLAAAQLASPRPVQSSRPQPRNPKGCNWNGQDDTIRFNPHPTGGFNHNGDRPLCKAIYSQGISGSNECRSGYEHITDYETCELAVAQLASPRTIQDSRSYRTNPKGCWWNGQDGAIYFNTHPTGSFNHRVDRPICKQVEATPN